GAKVLIFGRHEDKLNDALKDMGDYAERVHGITADVSSEDDVDRVFAEADDKLGGLDALINNAGLPGESITGTDPEHYRYIIETNLIGQLAAARRAVPRLEKTGGGTIVNIGSLSARERGPGSDIYTAAKTALRGFSDSLGKQLQEKKIRVSLIEPGSTGADFHPTPPEEERKLEARGEMLCTEAIAEALHYVLIQPPHVYIPLIQVQPIGEAVAGST
ncbi:MAG: SDR family oxidoreductase, partial [Phycisphaeraceae bacterium]